MNFSLSLEQVYVRGLNCRILRPEAIAGLAMVLAALPVAAQEVASQTALSVELHDLAGRTQATASISVSGADGLPASGVVSIVDGTRQLAQATLDGEGKATAVLTLAGGEHGLRAVYSGDASHRRSISAMSDVTGTSSSTPSFTVSLTAIPPSSLPLTLTAGDSGTIAVTVVPEDNSVLTTPMFVTLSCSGLPSLASCTFTPETIEILATTPTSCPAGAAASSCPPASAMLIQTQSKGTGRVTPLARDRNPVAWAIVLPGMLGIGGLAFGAGRSRKWRRFQRMTLLALLGLVTTLGATACNPLYYYYHHGPPTTPATPSGTFNITVTGQSSNGVVAISSGTTMVLTVK